MDLEADLAMASRETLLAIIAEQKATIAQLRRRIGALEERLNNRGSPGMPGNKPPSAWRPPRNCLSLWLILRCHRRTTPLSGAYGLW